MTVLELVDGRIEEHTVRKHRRFFVKESPKIKIKSPLFEAKRSGCRARTSSDIHKYILDVLVPSVIVESLRQSMYPSHCVPISSQCIGNHIIYPDTKGVSVGLVLRFRSRVRCVRWKGRSCDGRGFHFDRVKETRQGQKKSANHDVPERPHSVCGQRARRQANEPPPGRLSGPSHFSQLNDA